MKKRIFAVTGAITLVMGSAAFAQSSTSNAPAKKPGLLSRLFHPHPKTIAPAATSPAHHSLFRRGTGLANMDTLHSGIIGNKNTHVYHISGDNGTLPAPQNRVYFRTESEAIAAGYHASKQRGAKAKH